MIKPNIRKKLVGSLFEEDEIEIKQNSFTRFARDDKNHLRWSGAFTGGFTAGYKNTVGSKEGWAPK